MVKGFKNDADIEDFLRIKEAIEDIKKAIRKTNRYLDKSAIDKETGIAKEHKYNDIVVKVDYANINERRQDIKEKDIIKYTKVLKEMDCKKIISVQLNTNNKVVINRKLYKQGIKYTVVEINNYGTSKHKQWRIEDIYNDIDSFDNIKVIGDGIFEVYGLDGTYRYDINKIYNEYNNKSIESRSKLKAKLLDDMALEDINGKKS